MIAAWPTLPAALQQGILAIVRAGRVRAGGRGPAAGRCQFRQILHTATGRDGLYIGGLGVNGSRSSLATIGSALEQDTVQKFAGA